MNQITLRTGAALLFAAATLCATAASANPLALFSRPQAPSQAMAYAPTDDMPNDGEDESVELPTIHWMSSVIFSSERPTSRAWATGQPSASARGTRYT